MQLEIQRLSAFYDSRSVLKSISLSAHSGEILGLIGANGAGKSSLLRAISGTLTPTHGKIFLDDMDVLALDANTRAKKIAVVPQSARMPEAFSAAEVVLIGRTPHLSLLGSERASDYEIAQEAMARTDSDWYADRLMGELSGGEQQRVVIARALAQEPKILLLDEATAHLDLKHQTAIWNLVRQLARDGLIVIAALHDLNLAAQYADKLALLRNGELLVCDEPQRVLTQDWLKRAYDVSAVVSKHPLYHTPIVSLVE